MPVAGFVVMLRRADAHPIRARGVGIVRRPARSGEPEGQSHDRLLRTPIRVRPVRRVEAVRRRGAHPAHPARRPRPGARTAAARRRRRSRGLGSRLRGGKAHRRRPRRGAVLPDGSIPPGPDGTRRRASRSAARRPRRDRARAVLDAVQAAIETVVAAMDPTRIVLETLEPAILASIYPAGVPEACAPVARPRRRPPVPPTDRRSRRGVPIQVAARRTAIEDASVLVWETVLFEGGPPGPSPQRRASRLQPPRRPFRRRRRGRVGQAAEPAQGRGRAQEGGARLCPARRRGPRGARPPRRPKASPFEKARLLEETPALEEASS